jgi:methylmalonyl-CoA/ethylmalonyl-CoA epimerase
MTTIFRTHHIGVLVKDIASATESYVASLGYETKSDILHDPVQTAFVQFLGLPSDSACLELIAPDGPDSRLAIALKKGGGINHICYEVEAIEDAVLLLRDRKYVTIQAPVPAVAFNGRRIAWLMNRDHLLVELVEKAVAPQL